MHERKGRQRKGGGGREEARKGRIGVGRKEGGRERRKGVPA